MKSTYIIPECERETISREFARYQRKADAYGQKVSISLGDPYAKRISVYVTDEINHCKRKVDDRLMEVFDVQLDAEVIRKNGYTVVAKIEHSPDGNVVYALTDEQSPAWRTMVARCEHCGGNHNQLTTFIVRDELGNDKQVGRTCLKDYAGIDPSAILSLKQLCDILLRSDVYSRDFSKAPASRLYETVRVLALAIRVQKAYGYKAASKVGSNKEKLEDLIIKGEEPTVSEMNEAEQIAEEIKAMTLETAAKHLLDSVQTLLKRGYCKTSHLGFMAYAPLAYMRYNEARLKAEAEASTSEHVGEIGQRLTIELSDMKLLTSWLSDYGHTYMYKFTDKAGCVYIWYGSKLMEQTDKIKATVKGYNERDGIKQTIITRCKAA